MNKLLSGVCATSLAFAVTTTGLAPAFAIPTLAQEGPTLPAKDVIKVQGSDDVIKLRRGKIDQNSRENARDERRRERREESRDARRERQQDRREARQERREDWREARQDRREYRRDDNRQGYYRGHRGYREYRPGYKRHGDYWYPAAAFVAGALITGAIANSQPREVIVERGGSHEEWCSNRYRSYRAYDDTFQPNNGPRQRCISPY